MSEEIRDDEIIVDAKTGKFDSMKTTHTLLHIKRKDSFGNPGLCMPGGVGRCVLLGLWFRYNIVRGVS